MPAAKRISIIMEWENVQFAEDARAGKVLAALAAQADALLSASGHGSREIAAPIELLVLFDDASAVQGEIEAVLQRAVGTTSSLLVRVVATAGLSYFSLKNRGVQLSTGDLIVFLDSDVIPQPGWLATLVGSFDDPEVQVVGSRAFVRGESAYSRTVALTWFFQPLPETAELLPVEHFHANGVAFRRAVAVANPFPETPGQSRGAGWDLANQLQAQGTRLHEHSGALLDHPPPHGLRNYARRALVHGSDDLLSIRRRKGKYSGRLSLSIRRTARKWRQALANLICHRRRVGLSWPAMPLAVAFVSFYFGCYLVGDLQARLASSARPADEKVGGLVSRWPLRLWQQA
ncbi:MAG: glycosyltransferase family A protein [Pirellulaceae bacterium]